MSDRDLSQSPPPHRPTSDTATNSTAGVSGASRKPWEHAKSAAGSGGDPLAARFVESLSYDRRLYKHDIAGSLAHARMLKHVGLISSDDLTQIEQGLGEILNEIEAAQANPTGGAWPGWKTELEDVHMCIEAALVEKIGDAGRKLHTGRSRNDQVMLDYHLWMKEAIQILDQRFVALFGAFVGLAQRDGTIVMPSYTHLQRAQPIVVGGELIAWLTAFDRAQKRFEALAGVNRFNPLGSGAVAGSGLPLDRQHTADALGVGPPSPSSIDATASRDVAIDFVYALAMTAMTLSRWAEQWVVYASTEFSFVSLDGRYTTGSSMMPQKVNPDMLELIRGRCGGVYGNLIALLTTCKGLAIGYHRDLQEDKRQTFAAYDCVTDCLEMATRIVETTRFDDDKISQTLDQGFLDATSLAEYLVIRGLPFRTAHQIVGCLVQQCRLRGLDRLSRLGIEDFKQACTKLGIESDICGLEVYDWLGSEGVVQRYATFGSAGRSGFDQQLREWERRLDLRANG